MIRNSWGWGEALDYFIYLKDKGADPDASYFSYSAEEMDTFLSAQRALRGLVDARKKAKEKEEKAAKSKYDSKAAATT